MNASSRDNTYLLHHHFWRTVHNNVVLTKNRKNRPNHSSGGDAVTVDSNWSDESRWGDEMELIAGTLGQRYIATDKGWPNRLSRGDGVKLMVGLLDRVRIATARPSRTGHPFARYSPRKDGIIV